ncbi:MAG: DUF1585 domain-containing protein [Nannocystaceae bacterium]|nr:DUF1585 domain-containing protein [Myxococcales bacterium]
MGPRVRPRNRTWRALSLAAALGLSLSACGGETADTEASTDSGAETSDAPDPALVYLSPEEHLIRASMALRGTRPSVEELDAVAADPEALPGIIDQYLDDPSFGRIIRDLHNEALLSRIDFAIPPAGFLPKGPLAGRDIYQLNLSVMDAPLRLIEHVVMNDLPYSEIVTADYTVADDVVATVWGLDHPGGSGWEVTSWPDNRGNAGILSDSWLFQRHSSTLANANRGRANAISSALLCQDFLNRDIEIAGDVNLADANEVADAVSQNPTCVSCHQTLDPLASFFSGYFPEVLPLAEDYPIDMWIDGLFFNIYGIDLREPNYYGAPGDSLADLGAFIAVDPRFSQCATRRFYAYFLQVPLADVPEGDLNELQDAFIDSDLNARALTRAIVLSDAFRASHVDPAQADEVGPRPEIGLKKTRPVQLAAFVEDLADFRWRADTMQFGYGSIDLIEDGFVGFNVLAGGIDGYFVTRPAHTYNPTASLFLQNLARDVANYAIEHDAQVPDEQAGDRTLLRQVGVYDPDEAKIRAQLVELHLRILGERVAADSQAINDDLQLFKAGFDHSGTTVRAWKLVIAAMLQDTRVAFH